MNAQFAMRNAQLNDKYPQNRHAPEGRYHQRPVGAPEYSRG